MIQETLRSADLDQILSDLRQRFDWIDLQWIPLEKPQSFAHYESWIEEGCHGEMDYLKRHLPLKQEARLLLAEAQSIILVSRSYVPAPKAHGKLSALRLARYAMNEDYHEWFAEELREATRFLEERIPGLVTRVGVDSLPVLERDYARQAGLGWIGKNTCLIHKKEGSFSFLGEILTSAKVHTEVELVPDFCGTCSRCMEACPTGAIESPKKLDARKCISYWTIESKKAPPPELAAKFGDHFFGCDICQSVCPWNQKAFKNRVSLETTTLRELTEQERVTAVQNLRWVLSASDAEIKAELKDSPLGRAKAVGLRRNAMIVAANTMERSLAPEIQNFVEDQVLGELAKWCVRTLSE